MKIKDRFQLIMGIINILLGIAGIIVLIVQGRYERIALVGICLVVGIICILNGVETSKQRQKRREELQAMAEMFGWTKR